VDQKRLTATSVIKQAKWSAQNAKVRVKKSVFIAMELEKNPAQNVMEEVK
jgi:hypothetical protein